MGNCNKPSTQPLESRKDFLFNSESIKSKIISRLIETEQECLLSYESNSLSPIYPQENFIQAVFLRSNLVFKQQCYDSLLKELKSSNRTYEDSSFQLTKDSSLSEKLSRLFFINKHSDLYDGLSQVTFAKESFNFNLNSKANSNLFNCLLYIQLKNKYWVKNVLYKADYKRKIFLIKLFINALPKLIPLDEDIPVCEIGIPLYFNPPEKLYWVLLIEKAFAKVFDGYENIVNLQASNIFPFLTEAPLITYYHNKHSKGRIWGVIKEQLKGSNIIFVEGLHCYNLSFFIFGCFRVNETKYIELILPECSNKDAVAHIKDNIAIDEEDLKHKEFFPNCKLLSDKIIFMKLDFYYVYFDKTHLLKYQTHYINQVKRIEVDNKHSQLIQFKTTEPSTLLYLSIYRKPKNTMLHRITVAKAVDTDEDDQFNLKYIKSLYHCSSSLDNTLDLILLPGTYYVIITGNGANQSQIERGKVALSFYSSLYLDITKDDNDSAKPFNVNSERTMASLFESYLEEKGARQSIDNSNEIIYKHSISDVSFGYSLVSIDNRSSSKLLSVAFAYRIKGMNILFDNDRQANSVKLLIPPSKGQMVIFEWCKAVNEVSIDLKPKFELSDFIPISPESFLLPERKPIKQSLDLSYLIVPYFNGELIVVNNQSATQSYKVIAEVNEMINCIAHNIADERSEYVEIELFLPRNNEKMISIISIKQFKAFSYNISFTYSLHE